MPLERLVVVSDAHLGAAPRAVEDAFLAFLDELPRLGDGLLINGDLFHFWFGQRHSIPRGAVRVLAAIANLTKRVPLAMTGGNRDRWGVPFWQSDLGVRFEPQRLRLMLGDAALLALHGDCVPEETWRARFRHRVAALPVTSAVYRALPANFGYRLVDRFARRLLHRNHDAQAMDRAAVRQRIWAERLFQEAPDVAYLVMGHTHRSAAAVLAPGRHYLNPGAWLDSCRYGVVTRSGVELKRFPE